MENIYEKGLVNNDDEEMDSSKIRFCNKIKANKKNIFLIGLSLISLLLFCLIIILLFKKSDENGTSLEKVSSTSLNDPYFKKYSEFFPFSLRVNKEGQIEIENSSLEEISVDKLSFKKENSYSLKKVEVEQELKSSYSSDFSLSIDTSFYCDAKFQTKIKNSEGRSNKLYLIGAKYNICSLSIKRENIVFSNSFLNKIKDLSDDDITDAEKAKELDIIFHNYGYYIPLKIYIGGYFYKDINIQEDSQNLNKLFEFQANMKTSYVNATGNYSSNSENYIKNLFSNENFIIKGGDIDKNNLDDWKSSINFGNSDIIEYSNIVKITDIIGDALDKKTKKLLKVPLALVEEKYNKRKKYYEYKEQVKEHGNDGTISGSDSKRNGICQTDDLIYSEIIDITNDKVIDNKYTDLIVGWKVHSFWTDGTNGKFTLTDPINTRIVKATFTTKLFRELHYSLEIFFLKYPE